MHSLNYFLPVIPSSHFSLLNIQVLTLFILLPQPQQVLTSSHLYRKVVPIRDPNLQSCNLGDQRGRIPRAAVCGNRFPRV